MIRAIRVILLLGASTPSLAVAQTAARLIATDHWAYEYIGRLRDRGYLGDLNPLVQPYSRIEVVP